MTEQEQDRALEAEWRNGSESMTDRQILAWAERAADALAAARTENERLRTFDWLKDCKTQVDRVERERDEARGALANIAGMVEPWDWIPMRGDVLSEVDRILSTTPKPTEGNTDV